MAGPISLAQRLSNAASKKKTSQPWQAVCGTVSTDLTGPESNPTYRVDKAMPDLERRFYDDHDRKVNGSTPNLVSLLRPWIRCFTMIISAWRNLANSKLKKVRRKFSQKTWKQRQLLSESGFLPRIASPLLSPDRRMKMKKLKIAD